MAMLTRAGAALVVGLQAWSAGAATSDPVHTAITEAARQFLTQHTGTGGGRTEIEIGTLDPRLRLAPCGEGLRTAWLGTPVNAGRTTVSVQCPGAVGWTVYVTAMIKNYMQVVMAAHPLARGTVLTEADVVSVEQELSELARGYISDPTQAIGRQLRRPASAYSAITPQILEPQTVVRRGEQVTMVAHAGGLEVRASGTVLGDGATGERVRVRNLESKRVIEATVTGAGVVEIAM